MINIASLMLITRGIDIETESEIVLLYLTVCLRRGVGARCIVRGGGEQGRAVETESDNEFVWMLPLIKRCKVNILWKWNFASRPFQWSQLGSSLSPAARQPPFSGVSDYRMKGAPEKKKVILLRGAYCFLSSCVFVKHNLTFWLIKVNCYDYNEI